MWRPRSRLASGALELTDTRRSYEKQNLAPCGFGLRFVHQHRLTNYHRSRERQRIGFLPLSYTALRYHGTLPAARILGREVVFQLRRASSEKLMEYGNPAELLSALQASPASCEKLACPER